MTTLKEKKQRRILFSASRAGKDLEVYQTEKNGEIFYDLIYGDQEKTLSSREKVVKMIDHLGWKDWKVSAKGLMNDFPLGMAVLDRIRGEGREPWREWLRSAGWLQATIAGSGPWGEKIVSLLDQEKIKRHASLGFAKTKGLLSDQDQLKILFVDSEKELTPSIRKWLDTKEESMILIFTLQMPQQVPTSGIWIDCKPGYFQVFLEDFLMELLEGCYPFGILSNAFPELIPVLGASYEGMVQTVSIDEEEWFDQVLNEILGSVGWDARWGKVDVLFLLIQASADMVSYLHLYPLSLAIRQGVPDHCRVMASVKEIDETRMKGITIHLFGLKPIESRQ